MIDNNCDMCQVGKCLQKLEEFYSSGWSVLLAQFKTSRGLEIESTKFLSAGAGGEGGKLISTLRMIGKRKTYCFFDNFAFCHF